MMKLFIPVAAFAITATGVSAFNTDLLEQIDINLSEEQIVALETAHELRKDGDRDAALEVLEDAGLDQEILQDIREAVHEHRQTIHAEIDAAVESESYEDFVEAAAGTPLGNAIESESDFELLLEARELKAAGDKEGAKAIMKELGIERPDHKHGHGKHRGHHGECDTSDQ